MENNANKKLCQVDKNKTDKLKNKNQWLKD